MDSLGRIELFTKAQLFDACGRNLSRRQARLLIHTQYEARVMGVYPWCSLSIRTSSSTSSALEGTIFRKRWLRASNKTHHPKLMNPAVLVIDDEVFRRHFPASRSVEEMAVHLLEQHGGAPWLDRCAEKTCAKLAGRRRAGLNIDLFPNQAAAYLGP